MVARRRRKLSALTGTVAGASLLLTAAAAGPARADEPAPPAPTASAPLSASTDTGWVSSGAPTRMSEVRAAVGADALARRGIDGSGIGVALVDTGVVPVPGLLSGNVVNGPDLSFESQAPDLAHFDTFGHGTHMAGIIAGRDAGDGDLTGVAPGVRLTSVKVGSNDGAVDVSQVIAAVDWVVAHRNDDPAAPIRVLNLSYGTDGVQDARWTR